MVEHRLIKIGCDECARSAAGARPLHGSAPPCPLRFPERLVAVCWQPGLQDRAHRIQNQGDQESVVDFRDRAVRTACQLLPLDSPAEVANPRGILPRRGMPFRLPAAAVAMLPTRWIYHRYISLLGSASVEQRRWPPRKQKAEKDYDDIPGTYVFDAERSREGYHLNMFCMSLMKAENRKAFKDERGEVPRQVSAVTRRAARGDPQARSTTGCWSSAATSISPPSSARPTATRSSISRR